MRVPAARLRITCKGGTPGTSGMGIADPLMTTLRQGSEEAHTNTGERAKELRVARVITVLRTAKGHARPQA